MSLINYVSKTAHLKVIYYGPGLSGKTTNIQYIYEHTQADQRGKLVTLSTENERTFFYDFLPLGVGDVRGYSTRFHLLSIPGQTFYELPQLAMFKAVDGVVFVADSRVRANGCQYSKLRVFKANSRQTRIRLGQASARVSVQQAGPSGCREPPRTGSHAQSDAQAVL